MLKLEEGVDMKTVGDGNLAESAILCLLLELTSAFLDLVHGSLHVRLPTLDHAVLVPR